MILLDTNIIIDYMRGYSPAITYFENLTEPPHISVITIAELHTGVRNNKEKQSLDKIIKFFIALPVDKDIAELGGFYRKSYGKTDGTDLIDSLIAATAQKNHLTLITRNLKHFPMLENIRRPY